MFSMRRHLSHRDHGFSMVELVVAMVIIAILLTSLIATQIQALQAITEARKLQQATALANEAMEEMRAIPWRALQRGMYSGFNSAGAYEACGLAHNGGDPNITVSGGVHTLTVGAETFTLVVASSSQDQDLSQPYLPLFNSCGLNRQVREDPSQAGTDFIVRSYVTTPLGADPNDVGIVVVVEWEGDRGIRTTLVSSPSFAALTCGVDSDRSHFAGACQARLAAASRTGGLSMTVVATVLNVNGEAVSSPLVDASDWFSLAVNTASTAAVGTSEQTTKVQSVVAYGSSTVTGDPTLNPLPEAVNVTDTYELQAANDPGVPGAPPVNPPSVSIRHMTSPVKSEAERVVSGGSNVHSIRGLSDYVRPGDLIASTTTTCMPGVPSGAPCARAELGNSTNAFSAGYVVMDHGGATMRMMRRMNEMGSHTESSWVARFGDVPSTLATVGCTAVSGPGCISAGSTRQIANVQMGNLISASWQGGAASEGFVIISNYNDNVMVQRGMSQKNTAAVSTRTANLRIWNSSNNYQNISIQSATQTSYQLGTALWVSPSNPNISIQVTGGVVRIEPVNVPPVDNPDPDCAESECVVYADTGSVTAELEITVRHPNNTAGVQLNATLIIHPLTAQASFKDAPPQ